MEGKKGNNSLHIRSANYSHQESVEATHLTAQTSHSHQHTGTHHLLVHCLFVLWLAHYFNDPNCLSTASSKL